MEKTLRTTSALIVCFAMSVALACDRLSAAPNNSDNISIAVFEFELEDLSPSGALGMSTTSAASLRKATAAVRKKLQDSGLYSIVSVEDAETKQNKDLALRNCEGCEAEIAHKLGAQQSMFGVVRRATQTDYYIVISIRDARTGKLLDAQAANFAGGEQGWSHGARMVLKHQILAR